uniref:Uncharacterized protein n=1 Tax=viral metagenome TaxID=1070528 RepID=A0A6C0C180_9ZZZZ
MSFIFPDEKDENKKIDIDELFEMNHQKNLKQLSIFNKILNRIHKKIKITSRNKSADKYIWFNVPEYIFGEPIYDKAECLSYLVKELESNGFFVNYLHPNNLFISWKKWIPAYVREEFKKTTGQKINHLGELVNDGPSQEEEELEQNTEENKKVANDFTSTKDYKPTGKLIYNQSMFDKLEKKVSFK